MTKCEKNYFRQELIVNKHVKALNSVTNFNKPVNQENSINRGFVFRYKSLLFSLMSDFNDNLNSLF